MPTQTESPDVVLIGAGISITRTRSSYHARCARRFLAHGSSYWPTGFHASEAYPVTAGVAAVQPRDILPRGGTSAAISRSYGCRISRGPDNQEGTAGTFGLTRRNNPRRVRVHILDANHGYVIQTWTAGEQVSADLVARRARHGNLYVVYHHDEARGLLRIFCDEERWLRAKAEHDSIQQTDAAARGAQIADIIDCCLG